ncbi:hypothetical protein DID80_00755 [Candidatus Marinamargulisbacteria bacterium SCGC AAA071-K20]|nr:hypothetical protein DID80_00755 [Candidatus Marinamargulisbacteria bacterium SCGC AAA071-K20]
MSYVDKLRGKTTAAMNSSASTSASKIDVPFQLLLDQAQQQPSQGIGQVGNMPNPNMIIPQDPRQAPLIAQAFSAEELERIEKRRRQDRTQDNQALSEDILNELNLRSDRLDVTPFQLFMERAVEVLENISQMEVRVNEMTEGYVRGEISIDEVSMEMTKLNLAMSFATTVLSTSSQTLKELTQLAI